MKMDELQFKQEEQMWNFNRVQFIRIGMSIHTTEDFTLEDIRHMKDRMEEQNAKIAYLKDEIDQRNNIIQKHCAHIKELETEIAALKKTNQKSCCNCGQLCADNGASRYGFCEGWKPIPESKNDPRHDSVYQRLEKLETFKKTMENTFCNCPVKDFPDFDKRIKECEERTRAYPERNRWQLKLDEHEHRLDEHSDFNKHIFLDLNALGKKVKALEDQHRETPCGKRDCDVRCRTCSFCSLHDNVPTRHLPGIGVCLRHAPGPNGCIVVTESDWCGDYTRVK